MSGHRFSAARLDEAEKALLARANASGEIVLTREELTRVVHASDRRAREMVSLLTARGRLSRARSTNGVRLFSQGHVGATLGGQSGGHGGGQGGHGGPQNEGHASRARPVQRTVSSNDDVVLNSNQTTTSTTSPLVEPRTPSMGATDGGHGGPQVGPHHVTITVSFDPQAVDLSVARACAALEAILAHLRAATPSTQTSVRPSEESSRQATSTPTTSAPRVPSVPLASSSSSLDRSPPQATPSAFFHPANSRAPLSSPEAAPGQDRIADVCRKLAKDAKKSEQQAEFFLQQIRYYPEANQRRALQAVLLRLAQKKPLNDPTAYALKLASQGAGHEGGSWEEFDREIVKVKPEPPKATSGDFSPPPIRCDRFVPTAKDEAEYDRYVAEREAAGEH